MHWVENRQMQFGSQISRDLASHLLTRYDLGLIVIITDNPKTFISPLRKHWIHLTRRVIRSRTCTLDTQKIDLFSQTLSSMQNIPFNYKWTDSEKTIAIINFLEIVRYKHISTLYACTELSETQKRICQSRIKPFGTIVYYSVTNKLN